MKKAMITLFALTLFAVSAGAEEVKVCEGTGPDPHLSNCGAGTNFFQRMKDGYHLVSVVFANGKFYFYLAK